MGQDNDPPKNPFVRWKQHVDAHIGMTLNGLLGIPAMVTKNLNIRGEPGSDASAGGATPSQGSAGAPAPAAGGSLPPSSSTSPSTSPSSSASSRDVYSAAFPPASFPGAHPSSPGDDDGASMDDVDAAQLLEWHKFVYYSPYSPIKLHQQQHHSHLPPPIPNDIPFGADPYAFTYADAFEDLLRASSGRPLLDLTERSYRNLRYQMRYRSAVEPPYVFFHRMHTQGLLDAYFERAQAAKTTDKTTDKTTAMAYDTPRAAVVAAVDPDKDLWRAQREEEDADKNYDASDDDDDAAAAAAAAAAAYDNTNATRDPWCDQVTNSGRSAASPFGGGLFDELDRVFRVLRRIIDEDTGRTETADQTNQTNQTAQMTQTDQKKDIDAGPSADDELYDMVRSAYTSAEKSLSTFVKSFTGAFDTSDRNGERDRGRGRASGADASSSYTCDKPTTDDAERQGETIRSTEEHVDAFGFRHVKTVVRRLDADGNELARETRYTIRSPTPEEMAIRDASDETDATDTAEDADEPTKLSDKADRADRADGTRQSKPSETKPSGWFWK